MSPALSARRCRRVDNGIPASVRPILVVLPVVFPALSPVGITLYRDATVPRADADLAQVSETVAT
ncbi:hypothetical protein BRC91_13185 [Halobacteriales archaeon QS_4_62_28]|nr:MAG: hypothetical protein BRC91_13185 [Halobacteriales archaeon QS_4_62_28]